ncbi:hypothetical protein K1719_033027 [Acacia pycnantha]|nr:hypothetical protein K1719_033027 [Acacia pycnantha]
MLSKKLSLKCPIHRAPSQVTGKDKRRKKLFITNFKFKIQGSRSPSQGKNESTSRICHAKKTKIGEAYAEREKAKISTGNKLNVKSGRSDQAKAKNFTDAKVDKEDIKTNVSKGKKRKNDSGVEKGSVSVEKLVKIQIPATLKKQLVDDWDFVSQQDKE